MFIIISIGQLLAIVIPLISIAAVGCGLCWYFSGKKSFKKGYDTRKSEAEAVFGSAEAEGKRIVGEAWNGKLRTGAMKFSATKED